MSLGIHYNVGADLFTYYRQKEQLTPKDGYLAIPTDPGLGVDIDEDVVRELHVLDTGLERLRWDGISSLLAATLGIASPAS